MAKKVNLEEIDEQFIIDSFKSDTQTRRRTDDDGFVGITPKSMKYVPSEEKENADIEKIDAEETVSATPDKEILRRKSRLAEYEKLFLHESEIPARAGKSTYIRVEYHSDISTILRLATQGKVSMYSYIDNVLKQHFEKYEEAIRELEEKEGGMMRWKK